ncbi:MAG: UDP-N-acetyl-D-mannosamine dehydrogenase [Candidatus Methanofastidiosum methylothiophilum]|uniref:UDP-N-acetyl-D-mannosamine dehydrogenase n=1 Tax=Candidatus Methanofastidiosum methylothiophilum TaxID=1705564 RepID=A0A150IQJ2_9EURY|nr:MAG: UDP-N-acetyl-D-mannosamine dehydrogenase [Candidatus Methanofastidiosum methylthiophilus]
METLKQKIKNKTAVISIIGLGYVGLPTAVYFAEKGFKVYGVDKLVRIVNGLNKGVSHLNELGLDERIKEVVDQNKFHCTNNTIDAVSNSDIVLIIVPTPITKDKEPDLSYVVSAAEDISKSLKKGQLIVLESTVYPGVTDDIVKPILESSGLKAGVDFGLAYCPERYNPGDTKHTIDNVNRVVGGITREWADITKEVYSHVIKAQIDTVSDIKTAEAAKVIENIQRDLNIALMNELALIFEKMGIDVIEVIKAASTKWNFNVYYPGAGVGGHCLPVDPYYLVSKAREFGYHSKVITAGREINDYMPYHIFELLRDALNDMEKSVKNSKIAVLGFSYKENVGDVRETPVEHFITELVKRGAIVTVVDPYVDEKYIKSFGVSYSKDIYDALKEADAFVVMTSHNIFKDMDLDKAKKLMNNPLVIDGRRIFNKDNLDKRGFTYKGVGCL